MLGLHTETARDRRALRTLQRACRASRGRRSERQRPSWALADGTNGRNIDAANPRFVGGAIPNLAQLARAGVVIVVDAYLKITTSSKRFSQARRQKFEDSVAPGKNAAPNGPLV